MLYCIRVLKRLLYIVVHSFNNENAYIKNQLFSVHTVVLVSQCESFINVDDGVEK